MTAEQLKFVLEAALLAAETPLGVEQLHALFVTDGEEAPEREQIRQALGELQQDYAGRGVELVEVASGFRFQVCREFAPWVNRLWEDRPPKYSRALLETLAIIAYRQPITRAEIEDIRGVSVSSNIIKTLIEREWVRVAGHRDVPGRPAVYATTRQFLDYFNLKSLSDLPTLAELRDLDEINPDLFAAAPMEGTTGEAAGAAPSGGADAEPQDPSADTEAETAADAGAGSEAEGPAAHAAMPEDSREDARAPDDGAAAQASTADAEAAADESAQSDRGGEPDETRAAHQDAPSDSSEDAGATDRFESTH